MGNNQHIFTLPKRCISRWQVASAMAMLLVAALTGFSSSLFAGPAKVPLKIPHVTLAQVPWQRHLHHPTPIYIPLMSLPWADCHVMALHIPHPPVGKWKDPDCHFIMAMCEDQQGNLWFATEGAGVYRYSPSAPNGQRWTQFTKENTHGALENNCTYAIACDNHNRIWVGELNHGISVFNGKKWQDYDIVQNPKHHVLAGPLGNHVYAMKFDRHTNQMWIGTENGLSIYQCGYKTGAGAQAGRTAYPPVQARRLRYSIHRLINFTAHGERAKNKTASRAVDPPGAMTGNVHSNGIRRKVAPKNAASDMPSAHAVVHKWHYITQANGLPMNPDSLAFASNGMVLVGTQCGGLAVGVPVTSAVSNALGWSHYRWTVIQGPWHMPLTATGKGLPGNLVNSVTTMWANHLAVATDEGVALGRINPDGGSSNRSIRNSNNASNHNTADSPSLLNMEFEHGRNFVAKVHGLWHPPAHWTAPSGQVLSTLPTEDHTTAVAWQPNPAQGPKAGYLWLGHWRAGLDVWQYNADGKIIQRWHIHEPQVGNYVECLQLLKGNAMAVGCYGKGVEIITLPGQSKIAWRKGGGNAPSAAQGMPATALEPRGARPPSARELTAMANAIRAELIKAKGQKQPRIVPLPDDWRTEGNWLGRYGKYWMCMFGADHSDEVAWEPMENSLRVVALMGPHHRRSDVIRRWMQPPFFTRDVRALLIPPIYCQIDHYLHPRRCPAVGTRAMSEVDDHGETYPTWWQGPDVNLLFTIPKGLFVLSLYEWNYNGHEGANGLRDYPVSVQTFPAIWRYSPYWTHDDAIAAKCYSKPARVVARAEQNWGGQWIRFLVRGPVVADFRFCRNNSLNTHVLGAALDYFNEHPAPYYFGRRAWKKHLAGEAQRRRLRVARPVSGAAVPVGAQGLISGEELLAYRDPRRWAATESLIYAAALRRMGGSPEAARRFIAAKSRAQYRLALFNRWQKEEHRLGLITPGQVENALRWNHLNFSYRYFEFGVIRREVKALAAKRHAAAAGAGQEARFATDARSR